MQVHLRITREQTAENQAVEALGKAVGGEAGVEIHRGGFDEKGERRRIEFSGA